jgi:hypothetical protein
LCLPPVSTRLYMNLRNWDFSKVWACHWLYKLNCMGHGNHTAPLWPPSSLHSAPQKDISSR